VRLVLNVLLLLLQVALVAWGVFLVLVALVNYRQEVQIVAAMPHALPGQDSFRPPTFQRLATGVTTGLIAMGLGAVLFYLRRLYLARRPT
jgi:hypothetical protein